MSARLNDTIQRLSADLVPLRRLRPPLVRALGWLSLVAAMAAAFAAVADLPGVYHRLQAAPDMWLAVLGSATTAVLAAFAAFQLSLPDRTSSWIALPLPGLALWIGASGVGCLRSWNIPGVHEASTAEVGHCVGFILAVSIPLSALMLVMIRRAHPLSPTRAVALGGLAAAAAAATLLSFLHPYDASASDLVLHAVAVSAVIGLNRLFGGAVLATGNAAAAL